MLTRATDCGTGKHPNINVKTQISLELISIGKITQLKVTLLSVDLNKMIHCITLSPKTAGSKMILCLTLTIKSNIKYCRKYGYSTYCRQNDTLIKL